MAPCRAIDRQATLQAFARLGLCFGVHGGVDHVECGLDQLLLPMAEIETPGERSADRFEVGSFVELGRWVRV